MKAKQKVRLSTYYDYADNQYDMIECYYDDWFCYVIDYNHIGGPYDLEEIYKNIGYDVPHHMIPAGPGYGENNWIVDYAYYVDFHPVKNN